VNRLLLSVSLLAFSFSCQSQSIDDRYFIPGTLIEEGLRFSIEYLGEHPEHFKEVERIDQFSKEDSLLLSKYTAVDAIEAIDNMVDDSIEIVIISEHHHGLRTRAFNSELIQMLAKKGFKKLFVEALSYNDPKLNKRRFPIKTTGNFVREPFFAETLRLALSVGYTVLPYEARESQYQINTAKVKQVLNAEVKRQKAAGKVANQEQYDLEMNPGFLEMSVRDFVQYKNVLRLLDRGERCVIVCGHGHGMKKPYGGWRSLGWWFAESGIPTLSIENSTSATQEDEEFLRYTQFFDEQRPFVVVDSTRNFVTDTRYQPYTETHESGFVDASTLYPLNDWIGGSWQNMDSLKSLHSIDLSDYQFGSPFVIYTFLESEFETEGVLPTSAIMHKGPRDSVTLYLRPEKELIFLWDGKRKIRLED